MEISKLTLGTAQLGLNYGIANFTGKPDTSSALNILKIAWENGISTFDTAPVYGNSEELLGKFIHTVVKNKKKDINIISKLKPIEINKEISRDNLYNFTKDQVIKTLDNLMLKKLPIYLIHHAPDIDLKNGLIVDCLNQLKKEGLINRIGISIYNPREIQSILKYKEIDIIQVPLNIFDQRLIKKGLLKRLKKRNFTIFARSIYLQGLFFIPPEKTPINLEIAKLPLLKLRNISKKYNISIVNLAFLFVRDLTEITSIVVGVEKIEQLRENLKLLNANPLSRDVLEEIVESFSNIPEKIINPSLWSK